MKTQRLNESMQVGSFKLTNTIGGTDDLFTFSSSRFQVKIQFWISGTDEVHVDVISNTVQGSTRKTPIIASEVIDFDDSRTKNGVPTQFIDIVDDIDNLLDGFASGMDSLLGRCDYSILMIPSGVREVSNSARAMRNELIKAIR